MRPAVIVSNNAADVAAARTQSGVVTVVPVTSNVGRVFPFQVELEPSDTGLGRLSKARAEQVRSVSVMRLVRPVGWVDAEVMRRIDNALALHLAL
ncbi:type II toxin-antitoxin system toxin endoribonuclease MazF9 [Okibacterium endophyticum]